MSYRYSIYSHANGFIDYHNYYKFKKPNCHITIIANKISYLSNYTYFIIFNILLYLLIFYNIL